MTPQEQEDFDKLSRLNTGVTIAFMIMLSSKPNLTFTYTKELLEAFPFELYELTASNDGGSTTFSLMPAGEVSH